MVYQIGLFGKSTEANGLQQRAADEPVKHGVETVL
jgi:hypothetical protein